MGPPYCPSEGRTFVFLNHFLQYRHSSGLLLLCLRISATCKNMFSPPPAGSIPCRRSLRLVLKCYMLCSSWVRGNFESGRGVENGNKCFQWLLSVSVPLWVFHSIPARWYHLPSRSAEAKSEGNRQLWYLNFNLRAIESPVWDWWRHRECWFWVRLPCLQIPAELVCDTQRWSVICMRASWHGESYVCWYALSLVSGQNFISTK